MSIDHKIVFSFVTICNDEEGRLIVWIGYQVGKIYRKYCWDIKTKRKQEDFVKYLSVFSKADY